MTQCNKPYTIMHVSEIDVDDLATVPDSFLAVREVEDPATGNTIYTPVRVPGTRVMPTGNMANVTALTTNNTSLSLEFGELWAGYIDTQPTGNVMRPATSMNAPQFLMIGDYPNGKMLIQTTGLLTLPKGHNYLIGQQYYAGEDGAPTTEVVEGRKLFKPLSDTVINVNGEF